ILIGGGGKRVLTIAAQQADIIGINATMHAGKVGPEAIATMTAEAVDEKIAIAREAAAACGRLDAIEWNVRAFMVNVTADGAAARAGLAGAIGVEPSMVDQTPFALIGPPEELIERLLERREKWGFSYVIVGQQDVESFAPVVAALAGK
ncbi:MAG: hypothetical protein RJB65_2122, partial [Actinomycetota bacterium]